MKSSDPRLASADDIIAFSREHDISFEAARQLLAKHRQEAPHAEDSASDFMESVAHFLKAPS